MLDGQAAAGTGAPSLSVRLLPSGFPLRQQLVEHVKQLSTGGQLPLAEEDELLGRDLGAGFHLGEVRTVVADPCGERLLCQPSREPSTAQVGAELPRAFLAHVRADRLFAAWMLFATTGMRRGEVAGLRWNDVDLRAGQVKVVKPRVAVRYKVHVSEPKTLKGKRWLALDPATVAALREHRAARPRSGSWSGPAG